jgi:AcrR family transcriptional regulator
MSEVPPLSLREKKRLKTISQVQTVAMELFLRQGYESTTIQQIAAEAEVSESTFFRYFPTKEDVILRDDLDPIFEAALRAQPAALSTIQAVRGAFREMFGVLSGNELSDQRERIQFVMAVPELRSRVIDSFFSGIEQTASALAERTGRKPDDFAVRVVAGAIIGASMTVILAIADDPNTNIEQLLDQTMQQLENGLQL